MDACNPWIEDRDKFPAPLSGSVVNSFAYLTLRDRLPVILTTVIDHLCREKNTFIENYGQDVLEEIKEIIGRFSKLRNELTTNKIMLPIVDKGLDISIWNNCIESFNKNFPLVQNTWFNLPMLFVECYMYRRVLEAFRLSSLLQDYDPFQHAKENSFYASEEPMKILASHFLSNFNSKHSQSSFLEKLLMISLWSNKCDLSLSAGEENPQKDDPFKLLGELSDSIVINMLPQILGHFSKLKKPSSSIDIVLDNMGFELFSDLILADYLIRKEYCTSINFHVKEIPWFVSDTMKSDLDWLICKLKESCEVSFQELGCTWENYIDTSRWTICCDPFWTYYHPYYCMKSVAPLLYESLSQSSLLIFKGDLNYRKLVVDCQWNLTDNFHEALLGFKPTAMLVLRTLKSEVVVGLQQGQAESLKSIDQNWMTNGQFAVVQFVP